MTSISVRESVYPQQTPPPPHHPTTLLFSTTEQPLFKILINSVLTLGKTVISPHSWTPTSVISIYCFTK